MLASYGAGMLSIVFSFAQVVFLSFMGPGDIQKANLSTLYCVALFTILMLPLALLLLAALLAGVGFTGALWLGNILWIKVVITACYSVLLFILAVIAFVLC
ncbi:hypothetical protein EDC04DRAFT_1660356 [Pisolithus marmoratus]|nr:hypothetical protein EDC04DRAFT_1660356 [Pisolithus marmoratus]